MMQMLTDDTDEVVVTAEEVLPTSTKRGFAQRIMQ